MNVISVIIPTHNGGARIGRAVESALAQDHPAADTEIVIIDDGSNDESRAVLEQLAAQYPQQIVLRHQANAGPASARNHGMRIARGEFFAFLDDDDYWAPSKLSRQAGLLESRPSCGLVYCDAVFVDEDGSELIGYPRTMGLHRGDVRLALYLDQFLMPTAVMIRRSCIERCGDFDEALAVGEDYEFFLRISERYEFDFIAERLTYRVVRPGSLSRIDYSLDARTDLATLRAFIARNPDIARQHPDKVRARLGDYHIEFANRLFRELRIREGAVQWSRGFLAYPRLRPLKSSIGAIVRGALDTSG
ncbi:glycosyltransferase family 2 protein [Lysobacter ciconiae]|uniref:Glycosyltransferase family 2 protein n=1 Tax=Novilysobacter ciconiae TaxID=2781022 RepID=A0A7S6UEG4_9GAMM|nr:glycosyltransferase family A protein [Lysobacter ciconiae]QOW18802.1 glycosyltransferase family 2 protein [Lysobacter ciconiae]